MSAHLSGASMRQYRSFLAGADAPKEDSDTNTSEVVASIAKVLLDESAIKDVEVLKAKAANAKVLRDRFPVRSALWTLYDNRYRVLAGKLRAAQIERAQEQQDRASKLELVALSKGGIVVGILSGAALAALLVNLSGAARRHGRS